MSCRGVSISTIVVIISVAVFSSPALSDDVQYFSEDPLGVYDDKHVFGVYKEHSLRHPDGEWLHNGVDVEAEAGAEPYTGTQVFVPVVFGEQVPW